MTDKAVPVAPWRVPGPSYRALDVSSGQSDLVNSDAQEVTVLPGPRRAAPVLEPAGGEPERWFLSPRDDLYGGEDDWMSRGNTTIVSAGGSIMAGPLVGEAGILTAELDLGATVRQKRMFDCTGHYARPDVLRLVVDRRAKPSLRTVSEDLDIDANGTEQRPRQSSGALQQGILETGRQTPGR